MIMMFILSTVENWPNIMFYALDATDVGAPPIKNNY